MGSITADILRRDNFALWAAGRHGDCRAGPHPSPWHAHPTAIENWIRIRCGDASPLARMVDQMQNHLKSAILDTTPKLMEPYWCFNVGNLISASLTDVILWRANTAKNLKRVQSWMRSNAETASCWGDEGDGLSPIVRAILSDLMSLSAHGKIIHGKNLVRCILVIGVIMMPDNTIKSYNNSHRAILVPLLKKIYHLTCFDTICKRKDPLILLWLFQNINLFGDFFNDNYVVEISEFWHAGMWDCILQAKGYSPVRKAIIDWMRWNSDEDIAKAATDANAASALCDIMLDLGLQFSRRRIENLAPEHAAGALANLARVIKRE